MLDLNEAEKQTPVGEPIPDGTIVPVQATLRPGGTGDGGWLKRSRAGDSMGMDFEFTVVEGPFARRKFWTLFTIEGETDGQKKAASISRSRLRAMLESARGIKPADESEQAMAARRVQSYADFDCIRFWAVVGLEPAAEGSGYKDKNVLKAVVTPDRRDWTQLEQGGRRAAPAGAAAAKPAAQQAANRTSGAGRPSWAA